jgi:hypothetical protein
MAAVDPGDVAALLAQGDLREFLRAQEDARGAEPAGVPDAAPRRAGAWPTGTRSPAPTRTGTAEEWAHAAIAYRQWLAAGSPAGDFTCDCGCTPRGSP